MNTSKPPASTTDDRPTRTAASPPDGELVDRTRAGDRRAFRALVKRYERKVYGITYGFAFNREDAADLTQEVFVRVFRRLEGFQGQSSFYTWLYRVAVNTCIDYVRREKKHRLGVDYDDQIEHEDASAGALPMHGSNMGTDPVEVLQRKELKDKVFEAIEQLGESHREILVLREIEGLSYEELAQVLDIPKGTVMSRLFHARQKVKRALKGYLEERGSDDDEM